MMNKYLGLIEMTIMFGFAFAFCIWQFRSLNRDVAERQARERMERDAAAGSAGAPGHPER